MRGFFTKNLILLGAVFFSINLMGQAINTLTVTAPTSIAGDYPIVRAWFGSTDASTFTAPAATIATDGCTAITEDLTGKIAFIDRGVCAFSIKVLKAQEKGAVAVVICNSAANAAQVTYALNNTDPATGELVTIPTFMMSYNDCQKIKVAVAGKDITLSNVCDAALPTDAFWGNVDGQGNFNGGLGDWTIEAEGLEDRTTWLYAANGFPKNPRGFTSNDIDSKSQCNGVALMDIVALQSEDNPAFTQPYNRYTASLISPAINCTGQNSVVLEFTMFHNRLNGNATISFFDGTDWSAAQVIPTNNVVNTTVVGETVQLPVPQFANKDNCKIKFTVNNADFYCFLLDDVSLKNIEIVDVKVNAGFFAVAPSLKVPASQVSEMPFLSDISNTGNVTSTNTVLGVVIADPSANIIHTQTLSYGDVAGSTTVENTPFAELFTPPAEVGFYGGAYIIGSDQEPDGDNNLQEFYFEVTDKTFGNLLSEEEATVAYMEDLTDAWVLSDITNYYSGGNIYYVPNGEGYTVDKVRFGLQNDLGNIDGTGQIIVDLFEWNDLSDRECSEFERTLVGTGYVDLDAAAISDARNIELEIFAPDADGNASESPVALKNNTTYFLVAHTAPFDASVERYRFLSYSGTGLNADDRSIYPPATCLAFDTLGIARKAGSLWERAGLDNTYTDMRSRAFGVIGNEASLFADAMMYLEMDVKMIESTTYDVAKNVEVSTFPNPASREFYIDIALEKVSDITVDLVAMDGRTVATKNFGNVQDSRLKFELNDVVTGSYSALIKTNTGVITRKIVVQK